MEPAIANYEILNYKSVFPEHFKAISSPYHVQVRIMLIWSGSGPGMSMNLFIMDVANKIQSVPSSCDCIPQGRGLETACYG